MPLPPDSPYRPAPAARPPEVVVGVLLLLTEDQAAPERWLARAHLSEPTPGESIRQDLYLVAPEEVEAMSLPGLDDPVGGPVLRPALRQLLVALRERDARPAAGDGQPCQLRPLELAILIEDRAEDIVGVCLELREEPTTIALECVDADAGHWRRIDLGPVTAIRAQARAPFIER